MKSMFAKFSSVCASSGKTIKKGQLINYDPKARKAYLPDHTPENENQDQDEDNLRGYIEAQEQAFYDNQYRR